MTMNALNSVLNPTDHNPVRITKVDQDFSKQLNFKGIKFPGKIRDFHKIEKKRFLSSLAFLVLVTT